MPWSLPPRGCLLGLCSESSNKRSRRHTGWWEECRPILCCDFSNTDAISNIDANIDAFNEPRHQARTRIAVRHPGALCEAIGRPRPLTVRPRSA